MFARGSRARAPRLLMVAAIALAASCGAPRDRGLADMVAWSDGCCRPAWECAIAALESTAIGQDPDFRVRPPKEPYRAGARQPFRAESSLRVVDVHWTEHALELRAFGELIGVPLQCAPDAVGPLP